MLTLRPYKKCDAEKIASWCDSEETYFNWGGTLFGPYPLTADIINTKYLEKNGDCSEEDNFYPLTAVCSDGPVGSLIIRYINGNPKILRLGWVLADPQKRGQGYGKKMISLALQYAFDILGADTVTIGVYENNTPAYRCYRSCGFGPSTELTDHYSDVNGEQWKVVELEITKERYQRGKEQ